VQFFILPVQISPHTFGEKAFHEIYGLLPDKTRSFAILKTALSFQLMQTLSESVISLIVSAKNLLSDFTVIE
jgi:hypothetical protein